MPSGRNGQEPGCGGDSLAPEPIPLWISRKDLREAPFPLCAPGLIWAGAFRGGCRARSPHAGLLRARPSAQAGSCGFNKLVGGHVWTVSISQHRAAGQLALRPELWVLPPRSVPRTPGCSQPAFDSHQTGINTWDDVNGRSAGGTSGGETGHSSRRAGRQRGVSPGPALATVHLWGRLRPRAAGRGDSTHAGPLLGPQGAPAGPRQSTGCARPGALPPPRCLLFGL